MKSAKKHKNACVRKIKYRSQCDKKKLTVVILSNYTENIQRILQIIYVTHKYPVMMSRVHHFTGHSKSLHQIIDVTLANKLNNIFFCLCKLIKITKEN